MDILVYSPLFYVANMFDLGDLDLYLQSVRFFVAMFSHVPSSPLISPLRQTGLLVMGPENSQSYQLFKNTLQRNKVPMVVLTSDNFNQHIPHVNLAVGDGALVDITAGVLYADRTLKTVQVRHRALGKLASGTDVMSQSQSSDPLWR